jgi:5-oxoprolinase (ATP-hydrolysing) subunit A
MSARDRGMADAIARAVRAFDPSLVLFVPPASEMQKAGEAAGLTVAPEGFADRAYEPDGSLTPRARPGAVIHDTDAVVARAVRMAADAVVTATDGRDIPMRVTTLCVHGDTPGAGTLARALREELARAGITVRAVSGDRR